MENLEEINMVLKLIEYYSQKIDIWGVQLTDKQYIAYRKKEALEERLKELTDYLIQD